MRRILAVLLFLFSPLAAQAQVTPLSTWVNTRGSTLTVWFVEPITGSFTGTYVNNASGFDCTGSPYQAAGITQGTAISFTVDWKGFGVPNCNSTTVWRGQVMGSTMKTRWVLDYIGHDGKHHKMYGTDQFTKQ